VKPSRRPRSPSPRTRRHLLAKSSTVWSTGSTGLTRSGQLLVDKVTTVPCTSLTHRVGRLSDSDVVALDRALVVFLGLAV
jgi:mRNA-degrading endonuclease toxin of MazEF toxin-antitoxin module